MSLADRLPKPAAQDLVEWGPATGVASQFEIVLSRERDIRVLVQENPRAPILTDDRPVNEYFLLRSIF